jgi:hypothetical protein
MFKITRQAAILTFLVGAMILSACGAIGEEATPTTDPNIIFTQAAITVQAQLTEISALTPSATSTQAVTSTPMASPTLSTPFPTFAPLASSTPGASASSGGAAPSGNKCEYISQTYSDGTSFNASQAFDMGWALKNTGTTTWTTGYSYRKYSGDDLSDKGFYPMPKQVLPGETITVTVDMTAPSKSGKYLENWVLSTNEDKNFCSFYVEIRVGGTETPGPTKTAEPGSSTATTAASNEISYNIDADSTCDDIMIAFNASMEEILDYNDISTSATTYCDNLGDYEGDTLYYPE